MIHCDRIGVCRGQSVQQLGDKKMVSSKLSCTYCKGPHSSAQCNVITDMKAQLDVVKRKRLCLIVWVITNLCTVTLRTVVEHATRNIIVVCVEWTPHLIFQLHRVACHEPHRLTNLYKALFNLLKLHKIH